MTLEANYEQEIHNQCRYCKHYKAYDFHGFDGVKIYACENEVSYNPCIFEYDASKDKKALENKETYSGNHCSRTGG